MYKQMLRYLFWMRMDVDYNELIEGELLSIANLYGLKPENFKLSYHKNTEKECKLYSEDLKNHYCNDFNGNNNSNFEKLDTTCQEIFLYGSLPNENIAKLIFNRCILMRSVINVWAECKNYDDLLNVLINDCTSQIETFLNGKKWSVKLSRYNNKSSIDYLIKILDKLSPVFYNAGEVDLTNPNTKISIIEKYKVNTKTLEKKLDSIYFGNVVTDRVDTPWWNIYCLSTRPVLGPTSLENSLSFIMSNLGKVTEGSIVFDPFVGSGGSLIPSSIFGGYCFGCDIDLRILRGWGISYKNINSINQYDSSSVFVNFDYYKLSLPDIVRCDIKYTPFKQLYNNGSGWIDTIITDPPYGNRASFSHNKLMKNINNNVKYNDCFELIRILLNVSYYLLVKNGRLVFLLPANTSRFDESLKLINCTKFNLIHIGQQVLTGGVSRFVVVLEKN